MSSYRSPYRRRHASEVAATVSLTPLIDTALTLLVVFMVAAPAIHRAVRVDLPRGATAEEVRNNREMHDVTMSIDKEGRIFVEGKEVSRTAALSAVRTAARSGKGGLTVFMSVDKKVPSGITLELFADVQAVEGVSCVGFDYSPIRSATKDA